MGKCSQSSFIISVMKRNYTNFNMTIMAQHYSVKYYRATEQQNYYKTIKLQNNTTKLLQSRKYAFKATI